jgi:RNA polymerase sigma-70 factor (ECF subfamily)
VNMTADPPSRSGGRLPDEERGLPFEELVARYERQIFNLIYRQVGDYEDAADLTQETFINAYRAYGSFRGDSKVSTWLFQIALNACKNRFRQRDRMKPISGQSLDDTGQDEESEGGPREVPDWSAAPDRVYERKELSEQIEKAIANLPEEYRTVVVLRDMQHLSYQEIVEATGLSLENVKTRLHRARLMLRRSLEPYIRG